MRENLLAEIVDGFDDIVWALSLPSLTPIFFNDAALRLYQCSHLDLIENSQRWLLAIAPEDQALMQQAIATVQLSGSAKINYRISLSNGNFRWLSARLKISNNDLGEPIRIDAIASKLNAELEQRIEERTRDLARSEARNRAILQTMPDLLLLLKPDGTCLECFMPASPEREKYLPIHTHISEVLSSEDLQIQLNLYQQVITTGEAHIYEHPIVKFGKITYEEVRIAPYFEDELLVIVRDITNRKLVEEQLIKSDTHLKTAQRIGKIGSWEFDLTTGNVVWSEEVFRIFGRDPQIGTPTYPELREYLHPEDWQRFDETVQEAIANGKSYEIEHRICWQNGIIIYVYARGEIVCDQAGNPTQIFGIVMDISGRKKIEHELETLTDRLTVALKAASIGIWEWDIINNSLFWDDRTYELYGVNPETNKDAYQAWASRIHPSDRAFAENEVHLALIGEKEYEPEFRIMLPDGNIRYLKAHALVQRHENNEPRRLIGINFDITDRKLAEAELNRSRELREAIFNESTDALFLVDTQTLLTIDCNKYAVQLFEAADKSQLIGIEGHTLQRSLFTDQELEKINLELKTNGFWSLEVEYITLLGRVFWGNLAAKPIRLLDKTINLVRVTDISDRKRNEAKILHTAHQLELTNRELESFSYSVSHDLRAPLRHMNGFVNALQQQLKKHEAADDPKVIHYLDVVHNSSQKMGHLIDGLLTLSRYGRRPLEVKPVSIRQLVDSAIEIICADSSYSTRVEFAIGDLPDVMGDPTLIQQVFCNLIGNAMKFSRHQPQPRIEIDSLPDQTIRVKDNGVGFQMEYADKLFGAFQRLHTEKEFEGTGIGLAIVQRIIQRHNGRIWAESQPNNGATFFISFATKT
ncbi:MAG: hypothetical protein AUK48_01325 [Oscillatoriales cyanobacterium CG2_30_44_21]|nr:MAG: hypothetical protein AUK48_01325 [Oscillatoriales cyanobacterium CG2_30_44_21]